MKYEIIGEPLPTVVCYLQNGESLLVEKGGMSWMSPNLEMTTQGPGGVGKAFGRMLTKESVFQNRYTANGDGMIAIASSFPGSIKALDIQPGRGVMVQKAAYLAGTEGVQLETRAQKGLAKGLFGGEGFLMQGLVGQGIAFIEIDGHAIEYDLAPGQQLVISTGHLAMMDDSCSMEVVKVKGFKNIMLGGEGLFNTVVTGPGKVIVQTMPIASLATSLIPFLPLEGK